MYSLIHNKKYNCIAHIGHCTCIAPALLQVQRRILWRFVLISSVGFYKMSKKNFINGLDAGSSLFNWAKVHGKQAPAAAQSRHTSPCNCRNSTTIFMYWGCLHDYKRTIKFIVKFHVCFMSSFAYLYSIFSSVSPTTSGCRTRKTEPRAVAVPECHSQARTDWIQSKGHGPKP